MRKLCLIATIALLFALVACSPGQLAALPTPPTAVQVSITPTSPSTVTPFSTGVVPQATATAPVPTRPPGKSSTPRPTVVVKPTLVLPLPTLPLRVTPKAGAECPFKIPVRVVAPGPEPSHFDWSAAIQPMGDACVSQIVVDPRDDKLWYVAGQNALYVTRDGGATWERPLAVHMNPTLAISPDNPNIVYAASNTQVYQSSDKGKSWRVIGHFDVSIYTIRVMHDGTVYLGAAWGASGIANGIYVSRDHGANWQTLRFNPVQKGLISWDIGQDTDGTLYVGNEIYDHPKPYHPPFLRSTDGGKTWTDISGDTIKWHVVQIQINPQTKYVYALTEGAGLYGSSDRGEHWTRLGNDPTLSLLLDGTYPSRVFGGNQGAQNFKGGAFVWTNDGKTLTPIGLRGISTNGLGLNGDSTKLYVASYASGIYVSPIPADYLPR